MTLQEANKEIERLEQSINKFAEWYEDFKKQRGA